MKWNAFSKDGKYIDTLEALPNSDRDAQFLWVGSDTVADYCRSKVTDNDIYIVPPSTAGAIEMDTAFLVLSPKPKTKLVD